MPKGFKKTNPKAGKQTSKEVASIASNILRDSKKLESQLCNANATISKVIDYMRTQARDLELLQPIISQAIVNVQQARHVAASDLAQVED